MAVGYGTWYNQLANAGPQFAVNLVDGLVTTLVVLIILSIGYIVTKLLVFALNTALEKIKFEKFLRSHGVHDALLGFTATSLLTLLLGLAVMVSFLGVAAEVVNINVLTTISIWMLSYLPSLVEGVAIIAIALMAADYICDNLGKAEHVPFINALTIAIKVFIAYNALVIALPLVLPNASVALLETTFQLVIGALALGLGLGMAIAIGLGFKDTIADIAKKNKPKLMRTF
ncbi:hypothetical protein COV61_02935 [Candidatus Micrarchaeota archaeon CG11_big_fil_rev_8_21_14_0_20_47_5]|nr:MAG: hypothetical protein AUJ17_05190 [Candidatus Micrarchaeota archaeon CG1_02_47_40]PIN83492.1 MAG: hypothetical protein COV61_02935 [Candidatus Micrarchaeota archaeon CG11_big_fil_rev_8_21_14_0_20_47_5]